MTEDDLLEAFVELFGLLGWRCYHVRRSDRALVQGKGGAGWPDIIAADPRTHRLVALELKSNVGMPTEDQLAWLSELRQHPTLEATIVRPATYDAAIDWIRGTGPMPSAVVVREESKR